MKELAFASAVLQLCVCFVFVLTRESLLELQTVLMSVVLKSNLDFHLLWELLCLQEVFRAMTVVLAIAVVTYVY